MPDGTLIEQTVVDTKHWEVEPKTIQTNTKSGKSVECVITPYLKVRSNVLHIYNEQDGIQYDIPTEGELNLVINVNESNEVAPIGAMSLTVQEFVPTINMIQQVKAYKKISEGVNEPSTEGIVFGPTYEKIQHPAQTTMHGKDSIDWQRMLLNEGETLVRQNGFDKIRLVSGFSSRYLDGGHPLGLAVQQYDKLVSSYSDWTPYNSNGVPINDPEQRKLLNSTLRKLRDGNLKTKAEVKKTLSEESTPIYWQKNLGK